jgi:acetyl esterase/lipase
MIIQMFKANAVPEGFTVEQARAALDNLSMLDVLTPGTTCETTEADGVPGEWISAPSASAEATLYWLHGGGYSIGSVKSHRGMIARLSAASKIRAFAIDYRLAPENPFPAGLEDALTGYRWLLKQGVDPKSLIIAGDSAGGGMTLAVLVSLRDSGEPLPAAAVLYSPWTDLTWSGESVKTRAEVDPWISPDIGVEGAALYLGDAKATNPLASPLFADLSGLPPTLIQVGDAEVLLDDSTRVAEKMKAAGVEVTLEVWDEMIHVWQAFASILPEGQQAIDKTGEFIRSRVKTGAPA